MSVPFEALGPGQVGRLVYQVIGQRGPISNPSNIRYLPPGEAQDAGSAVSGVPGLDFAIAAGQIANLGLGLANLGVSAAVLSKLKDMDERVEALQAGQAEVDAKLDQVLRHAERIDIATAEQNLRSSLRHVLSQAISDEMIDLRVLCRVESDLERFVESLRPATLHVGLHPGLRLSSDVRDMASSALRLLRGARLHTWSVYNRTVQGAPTLVVSDDALELAMEPSVGLIVANVLVLRALEEAAVLLFQGVEVNSIFGNDKAKNVISEPFGDGGIPDQVTMQMFHVGQSEANIAYAIASSIDTPSLEDDEEASQATVEIAETTIRQYLAAWSTTDAALLYQLGRECWLHEDRELWDGIERAAAEFVASPAALESAPVSFDPGRAAQEIAAMA